MAGAVILEGLGERWFLETWCDVGHRVETIDGCIVIAECGVEPANVGGGQGVNATVTTCSVAVFDTPSNDPHDEACAIDVEVCRAARVPQAGIGLIG